MTGAILYSVAVCFFVAALGLGVGVMAYEIRRLFAKRDDIDFPLELENKNGKD